MNADQISGGIFGVAVGDALGVPVEFESREERNKDPVTDFRANGTHSRPEGTWSDDTSLTLALLDSLSSGLDYTDIARKFLSWKKENAYSAAGRAFDIGNTTLQAILNIERGTDPVRCGGSDEHSNGNGSLMRILPAAFHVYNLPPETGKKIIFSISGITHSHLRSRIACLLYSEVIRNVLSGQAKDTSVDSAWSRVHSLLGKNELSEFIRFDRCISKTAELTANEISSGGYVVDSLEASLWCFLTTENYRDAVLKAVNLGADTDTTAAVTGGLAGTFYGISGIPAEWIKNLQRSDFITNLIEAFIDFHGIKKN